MVEKTYFNVPVALVGHEDDGFEPFRLTHALYRYLAVSGQIYADQREVFDIVAAVDLIRSYLWRVKNYPAGPFLVCMDDEYDDILGLFDAGSAFSRPILFKFGDFVAEARALTFVEKALRTLENLNALWLRNRTFIVPHLQYRNKDNYSFRYRDSDKFDGMSYGFNPTNGYLAYEYLYEEGYIRSTNNGNESLEMTMTPKGMKELDTRSRGKDLSIRQVFFIRAFDNLPNKPIDKHIDPLLVKIDDKLKCSVRAVWQQVHNDNIIERIFRGIRESPVVVADITGDRFNVGLELGYALALGKPIILMKAHPDPWYPSKDFNVPFDIGSLNCLQYELSAAGMDVLLPKLVARIGLAFDVRNLK